MCILMEDREPPFIDSPVHAGPSILSPLFSDCVVTEQWLGFHRIWRGSGILFDTVDLFLPPTEFQSQAALVRIPDWLKPEMRANGLPFREGVHAASHAVLAVLGSVVACSPGDVKAECDNPYATRYRPERVLLYDSQPGGVGLAAQVRIVYSIVSALAAHVRTPDAPSP